MAGETYTLTGMAVPEGLEDLHDLVERVGRDNVHVSPGDLALLETAVIEIAGNVVEHGRPEGRVRWTFSLSVHADRLEAVLADDGLAVSALEGAMPDVMAESGRGLALARRALDSLDYDRVDGTNRWRLVRALS